MYFGAKPSHNFSPVPASTSATSNSVVLRRRARNSEIFFRLIGEKIWQEFRALARTEFATCQASDFFAQFYVD
jgi:hypothetical protein